MSIASRVRGLTRTTPGLYRVTSLVVAALLVLTAVLATIAADAAEHATARLKNNTGPVLVATQSLLASLAEADAAATAAFLSGTDEDREQRRLYEEAVARANVQSEEISALIGDDAEAHDDLKSLSIRVNRYAGLIEAARATAKLGAPGSETYLLSALDELGTGVRADAARLTRASERRFDEDEAKRTRLVVAASILGGLALVAIVAAAVVLARRSRRLVNPLLAVAAIAALATVVALVVTDQRAGDDLDTARRHAYESIAVTAKIQEAAFASRTDESVALIAGDASRRAGADEATKRLSPDPVDDALLNSIRAAAGLPGDGLLVQAARLADSNRERAAVAEMAVRWQRYQRTVAQLRAAAGDDARRIAVGPASAAFNGFNFSVEGVLGDNRDQFLEAIDSAAGRTSGLSALTLVLPLLAAAAALAGFQMRINEYR